MKSLLISFAFFLAFLNILPLVNGLYYNTWDCCSGTTCVNEGCSKTVSYASQCTVDQCTVGICRPECGCGCNNNSICDSTETQDKCNADCYTTVSISPNIAAVPGQEVILTISFNDSRYVAGHIAKYSLTIDGIAWNADNGCNIAEVNVTPTANGINTACTWQGLTKDCSSTSVNGSLKVTTKCNLPYNMTGATHSLVATPTFYSQETILSGASVKFTTQQKFDLFEWILSFFR